MRAIIFLLLSGCLLGWEGYDLDSNDDDGDHWSPNDGDCDDDDPDISPNREEVCDDAVDNNCDGLVDEECETVG